MIAFPVTNGYPDGSGKGTIVDANGQAILRTHWGCSCCDFGADDKDIELAENIVAKLNAVGVPA